MSVNQDIVRKFEKFSLSLSHCAESEIKKIKVKLTQDLIEYDQSSFALVIMGSLAKREPSKNYDRDSILIFENDIDENLKDEITKKCISSFDELGIPKCTGGMSIDSEQAVRSLGEWREFFGKVNRLPLLKNLIFVEAMRSSIYLSGNQKLFENHQSSVGRCILNGVNTDLLLVESFLNLFSFSKNKTKLILSQIIKFNYVYEPSFLFELSFARGVGFLERTGNLSREDINWLKEFYISYTSNRSMIAFEGKEIKNMDSPLPWFKLRFIALKILVKVLSQRIIKS